jgi:peptidylprolyl isomerase
MTSVRSFLPHGPGALACLLAVSLLPLSGTAQQAPAPIVPASPQEWSTLTSGELIARAPADAWKPVDADNLLVMRFRPTPDAAPRTVLILLAPELAPRHAQALRALARGQFFDGKAIVRSQDNYVAQWGDGAAAAAAGLPGAAMAPEFDVPLPEGFSPLRLRDADTYAPRTGVWRGWPVAWDPRTRRAWLPHCYGMVGAGRDMAPDSGGPAELYAVNGHSPRALDRNVTLLGRVVQGMEHLTTLPRGTEALGFYGEAQVRPPIESVRLAADLPEAERPRLEQMDTAHPIYAQLLDSRRSRRDSWTLFKAERIEICNAPLPVRVVQ